MRLRRTLALAVAMALGVAAAAEARGHGFRRPRAPHAAAAHGHGFGYVRAPRAAKAPAEGRRRRSGAAEIKELGPSTFHPVKRYKGFSYLQHEKHPEPDN